LKKRLLFYVDGAFINFFIAKTIKEQIDCEVYVISVTNTDEAKQFFKEQNLLKIDGLWYYPDHIPDNRIEPNIEYLKKIEEQYGLNFWKIASYDRKFYPKFNKFYKFSRNEILLIFEQATKFFEYVIDKVKPDFFIVNSYYAHDDVLFYEICKAKGINPLVLFSSRLGTRCLISKKYDKMEDTSHFKNIKYKTFEDLQKFLSNNDTFKLAEKLGEAYSEISASKIEKLKALIRFIFVKNNFGNHYNNYGKSKLNVLFRGTAIQFLIKKKLNEKFINKNFKKNIVDSKFVFFPLHFEPERSMLVGAPFYPDQIEIIRKIAKSMPIEYKVYVKEHPAMIVAGWRSKSFYKELLKIPNIRLIYPLVNPIELYKKCSLVLTINGTSSLEANIYEKPSILFGSNYFSEVPSIIKVHEIQQLPKIIQKALTTVVDPKEVSSFITKLEHYSFEFYYDGIARAFMNEFSYPGYLQPPKYPIDNMKNFYLNHKEEFELVAKEFIKNIKKELMI